MAAHVGRLVDEEGGPRASSFQPRERARGAGVEDRDPDVGRDLVEPIPQRPVRVAIVADQQSLLVGVAGVIEEDLGPPGAAGGAARVHDVLVQQVERVEQLAQPRLLEDDLVRGADAPELHEHPRETLGVGDRVLQQRSIGAARVRADDQRKALHRGRRGRRSGERGHERGKGERKHHRGTSFCRENVDCVSSRPIGRIAGASRAPSAAALRAASTIGATGNGVSPVTK